VIAALGVVYHPSIAAYIVSGVIWAGGIGIMLYQIQTGEDTNLMPYIVMIISAVVFGIWATSGPTF
jgi:hypothetical protein